MIRIAMGQVTHLKLGERLAAAGDLFSVNSSWEATLKLEAVYLHFVAPRAACLELCLSMNLQLM